jgi:hypothetical protein
MVSLLADPNGAMRRHYPARSSINEGGALEASGAQNCGRIGAKWSTPIMLRQNQSGGCQ